LHLTSSQQEKLRVERKGEDEELRGLERVCERERERENRRTISYQTKFSSSANLVSWLSNPSNSSALALWNYVIDYL